MELLLNIAEQTPKSTFLLILVDDQNPEKLLRVIDLSLIIAFIK